MEFYHILNRGVDKRDIFLNEKDYLRFVHNLFEFNNQERVDSNRFYFFKRSNIDIGCPYIKKSRKLLVNIHLFCLMQNHYHLLLSSRIEDGIPRFMQKLNMGYAKYFNEKHKRSGALFEGKYKSVLIEKEAHFFHIPYYIHFNPLDFKFPEWRNNDLKDCKKAKKFLDNYRWSSHLDYLEKKNFPSVTQRKFLLEVFGGTDKYKENIWQSLKGMELAPIKDIVLE
ncbi:transposase [Patescibacteria group bacterium]|nr:transposase [Patescibacteria group bacterium]